jgi:hypothetical protein
MKVKRREKEKVNKLGICVEEMYGPQMKKQSPTKGPFHTGKFDRKKRQNTNRG